MFVTGAVFTFVPIGIKLMFDLDKRTNVLELQYHNLTKRVDSVRTRDQGDYEYTEEQIIEGIKKLKSDQIRMNEKLNKMKKCK